MNINDFNGKVDNINVRIEQLKELVFRVVPIGDSHYSVINYDVATKKIKVSFTNMMFHPVIAEQLDSTTCDVDTLEAAYTHMQHKVMVRRWLEGTFDIVDPEDIDDGEESEFPFEKNEEAINAFTEYVKQLKVMEPSDNTADEYGIPKTN